MPEPTLRRSFDLVFVPIAALGLAVALLACDGDDGDSGDTGGNADAAPADAAPAADAGPAGAFCPVVGYAPCGGALAGTWVLGGMCPDVGEGPPCESPFSGQAACDAAGNTATCRLEATGTMTFTATDVHLLREAVAVADYVFTDACMAAVRPGEADLATRCAALANPPRLSCAVAGVTCACTGRTEPEPLDETSAYTVNDTTLAMGELGGSYCVDGDTLTIDFTPHPLSWRHWVLTRQP